MTRSMNVLLTIPDPYVIRLSIEDPNNAAHGNDTTVPFYPTLRRAKQLYKTSPAWAYSNPFYETRTLSREHDFIINNAGHSQRFPTSSIMYVTYWAFQDKQDAVQFQLTFGESATHVYMWDSRLRFTLIENE